MSIILSIALDLTIVVLLATMIFFSVKLSAGLKAFRESRGELSSLLGKLSVSIAQAEQAVSGMRNAAKESGNELQDVINKAISLSDELQFINEAGNNLAKRLENLADRGGKMARTPEIIQDEEEEESYFSNPDLERIFRKPEPSTKTKVKSQAKSNGEDSPLSPFLIRDRDYERGEEPATIPAEEFAGADAGEEGLRTRAERDLYAAMMKKRNTKAE